MRILNTVRIQLRGFDREMLCTFSKPRVSMRRYNGRDLDCEQQGAREDRPLNPCKTGLDLFGSVECKHSRIDRFFSLACRVVARRVHGGKPNDVRLREASARQSVFSSNDASADWARLDSNQGPRDYESPALTAELQARVVSQRGSRRAKNVQSRPVKIYRRDRATSKPLRPTRPSLSAS